MLVSSVLLSNMVFLLNFITVITIIATIWTEACDGFIFLNVNPIVTFVVIVIAIQVVNSIIVIPISSTVVIVNSIISIVVAVVIVLLMVCCTVFIVTSKICLS